MITIALILIAVLVAGCGARTIPVVSSADVDDANEGIRDRGVTMRMENGSRMPCERAVVGLDTCTCVDARAGAVRRVSAASVESIKVRRPGRGATRGLLIGGGIGGLMGGILYLAEGTDDIENVVGMVLAPIFGAVVGLVFGPFVTYDLYEIRTDEPEPNQAESAGSAGGGPDAQLVESLTATPPN
jgi:hypothetical protein